MHGHIDRDMDIDIDIDSWGPKAVFYLLSNCTYQPVRTTIGLLKEPISGAK